MTMASQDNGHGAWRCCPTQSATQRYLCMETDENLNPRIIAIIMLDVVLGEHCDAGLGDVESLLTHWHCGHTIDFGRMLEPQ